MDSAEKPSAVTDAEEPAGDSTAQQKLDEALTDYSKAVTTGNL